MKKNILIVIVLIFIIAFIVVACEYTKKDAEISASETISENIIVKDSSVVSDNSLSDNSALKDRIKSKRTTSGNSVKGDNGEVKGDNGEDAVTPYSTIDQSLLKGITNPSDIPQEYIDSIISAFPELQQYDPAETSDNVRAWIGDMGVEFYAAITAEAVYRDFSEIAIPSWSDMFSKEKSTTSTGSTNATTNTTDNTQTTEGETSSSPVYQEPTISAEEQAEIDAMYEAGNNKDTGEYTGETGVTN